MSKLRKLGVFAAVIFAFSAIGAANASASTFTYSATGTLAGHALETHKFKTSAGTVECRKAESSGTVSSTNFAEQEMTVEYRECSAFGFPADLSQATYVFTASGELHIESPMTVTVTAGIFGHCTITFGSGKWLSTVGYANVNTSRLKVTPAITGIHYSVAYVSGSGICGSTGEHIDGTYSGASEIERVGGGSISWDA